MAIAMHLTNSNCTKKYTASKEDFEKITEKLNNVKKESDDLNFRARIGTILTLGIGMLSVCTAFMTISSAGAATLITAAMLIAVMDFGLNFLLK